uniref:Uncharacterized protein n=1 Tax=Syphacia muris TaxID=451379 RepID=A0A0N5AV71_9BILA
MLINQKQSDCNRRSKAQNLASEFTVKSVSEVAASSIMERMDQMPPSGPRPVQRRSTIAAKHFVSNQAYKQCFDKIPQKSACCE